MPARPRFALNARLRATLLVLFGTAGAIVSAHAESAAEVLAAARNASGGAAWDRVALVRSIGEETFAGLRGRWQLTEDTVRGRYAQVEDFGIYKISEGFDGSRHWRQDRSGGVHALDSAFAIRNTRTDAWLVQRGYLKANDGTLYTPPDERVESGARYWLVQATPSNGEPVQLWFDAASHRLARIVRQMPISVLVVRLEDYREVDGVSLPFRIVFSDDNGDSPAAVTIESYKMLVADDDRLFALAQPPDDTRLARPTRLPAEIDGQIVVRATLNGKGPFGFIVDTGGHNILTPAAASALGLTAVGQGQSGGAGEGTLPEQAVRVADLRIGAARLKDQYFSVIPFTWDTVERGPRTPLAGLLGLDIFERFIVRIDYRRAVLDLIPNGTPIACTGEQLPIRFEDDSPEVEGTLDGVAGIVSIDTGNGGSTVVQGVWAARSGLAERLKRGVETVSFGSGGVSRNWVSEGHVLGLGGQRLSDTAFRYAEDAKGAFSSRTEAANAGYDVLAHYTVTFDYGRSRMCLEPSPGFRPPPMNRSGLGLSKGEPSAFTVVQVRAGSPGALAGIREGDKIVAINGRAASRLSSRDAFNAVRRAPGTRVRMRLRRGETDQDVSFVLEQPR